MQSVDNIITKAGLNQSTEDAIKADTNFGFLDREGDVNRGFHPRLIANAGPITMKAAIQHELARCTTFKFSVAFITTSAIAELKNDLVELAKGRKGTIYTSTYLDFNEPAAFEELMALENLEVRVLKNKDAFHSKGYIFEQEGATTAIIGSSNLTRGALLENSEWNMQFSALPGGDIVDQLNNAIDHLHRESEPLTQEWIDHYAKTRRPRPNPAADDGASEEVVPEGKLVPNKMQNDTLDELKKLELAGESKALIVSATGTGKTILSAFATQQFNPERMLFIAHREQILDKATEEYQRVLEDATSDTCGKFVGSRRELDQKYTFATIQSLTNRNTLESIDPNHFDLIIIDEVHRAGAQSYRKILEHFNAKFTLGMTATPERTDGFNVFSLFDHNIAQNIRLQQALEEKMLVPFTYQAVTDYVDSDGNTVTESSDLARLVSPERVEHLVDCLRIYGLSRDVHGLMFCSSTAEADELSTLLNEKEVYGRKLRTKVLTGTDSMSSRVNIVKELESGQLDYILTVDIFNEGIDIPCVNQIVMMRPTQSPIIFTQQLGRGLRKLKGKTHLRVIDFVGNYQNNYNIALSLFEDKNLDKDGLRQELATARRSRTIFGLSSVNVDEISYQRILKSLNHTKLDSMVNLCRIYRQLEAALGRQPMRLDFATSEKLNPTIIATHPAGLNNFWEFQKHIGKVDSGPTEKQAHYLNLLDNEFLNGKRPQELVLLRELLKHQRVSVADLDIALSKFCSPAPAGTLTSVAVNCLAQIFSLDWFTAPEQKKYGHVKLADFNQSAGSDGYFSVNEDFYQEYQNSAEFKRHVDDVIDAGLHTNRHDYNCATALVVGRKYTRKDACRLLNWRKNEYGGIFGYKLDRDTNTCPIFVTYHKDSQISSTTQYEDAFESRETLRWFTRSGKTLRSKLEREIAAGQHELPIFVKKDDFEGRSFFYVGTGTPRDAVETTMAGTKSVVEMRLDLANPLDDVTLDLIQTPTKVES